jgi:hypothetical protein
MAVRDWGRLALYAFLFMLAGGLMLFAAGVLHMVTSFLLWLIAPPELVYAAFVLLSFLLFGVLLLLARRRRWGWLQAVSLGGVSVPVLLIVLMLLGPLLPRSPRRQEKPNQKRSQVSPSGRYVLSVPIERSQRQKGPLGYGMPYWHVTIADPNGRVLYRDPDEEFDGLHTVYWVWDEQDRVWLFNSDDGSVYFYEEADATWSKGKWGQGRTGHVERDIAPPEALYPSYVSGGPVRNQGTPWMLSGLSGSASHTAVVLRNAQTGEFLGLYPGETKNGVTLVAADWDRQEAVVEIKGKRFTLTMPRRR